MYVRQLLVFNRIEGEGVMAWRAQEGIRADHIFRTWYICMCQNTSRIKTGVCFHRYFVFNHIERRDSFLTMMMLLQ